MNNGLVLIIGFSISLSLSLSLTACKHNDCIDLGRNGQCDVRALTYACTLTHSHAHTHTHTHTTHMLTHTHTHHPLPSLTTPQLKCFTEECGFDGEEGYCLPPNSTDPWKDCQTAGECRKLSENGQCDPQCNSRECLFDSYECFPPRATCPADKA